jgi:hypothetical protein
MGLFRKRKSVIGPHVIQPTGERGRLNDVNNQWRTLDKWECKYCDWEGFHPDDVEVNIKIKHDCDGIEWTESEKIAFDAE